MLSALPALIAFQVLVLAPLGIVALFGLASRLGGRLFGYATVVAWILAPVVALWFFWGGVWPYRDRFHDQVLPNALGLTTIADYTSMILTIVAVYLIVRAIDDRRWDDVVLAGLVTGTLIAVKPSNGYFLIVPVLAFALHRRFAEGVVFFALLLPALVTLTIWKKIGLGYVPLNASPSHVAAAPGSLPTASTLNDYFPFEWDLLRSNFEHLHEMTHDLRVLEVVAVAGLVGLIRRVPAYGITVGAWFATYLLFKGGAAGRAYVDHMSFFRFVLPALPALVLMTVSVVFLFYRRPRRAPVVATPAPPTRVALVAAFLLAVYPLVLVATTHGWSPGRVAKDGRANLLVPVSDGLRATAVADAGSVRLAWRIPPHGSSRVHFQVFRSRGADCALRSSGSRDCLLRMDTAGFTDENTFVDDRPPSAGTTYRIGMLAGWTGLVENADLLVIGPPLRVERVGRAGSSG
jgi:hypothetical protein